MYWRCDGVAALSSKNLPVGEDGACSYPFDDGDDEGGPGAMNCGKCRGSGAVCGGVLSMEGGGGGCWCDRWCMVGGETL